MWDLTAGCLNLLPHLQDTVLILGVDVVRIGGVRKPNVALHKCLAALHAVHPDTLPGGSSSCKTMHLGSGSDTLGLVATTGSRCYCQS